MNDVARPARGRRALSLRAKIGASVGLAAIGLLLLEGAVRLAGAGDPSAFGGSRLQYQHVFPPLFRKEDGKDRWRPRDPRLVDRSFPARTPEPRVFVFGESAVFGLGTSENASFPRALERDLRALGSPAHVVNCGIVALDSRQVRLCVEECCKDQRPDWVVLHVGNNEFLELHALRYLEATGRKPCAVSLDETLAPSRLYTALRNASLAARNRDLTPATFATDALRLSERALVETKGVSVSPQEIDAAIARHLENLRACVKAAQGAGAKVVLVTVATNLEWTGMRDLEAPLPERGSDDPLGRWARSCLAARELRSRGDLAGAREEFRRANDEDPHLRRCLSRMNENVRALAGETGAVLVDGARLLGEASKDGICGFDMLYDYVHFTPEGAERLGAALAEAILAKKPGEAAGLVEKRRALLSSRERDALEVEEYLGWNADRALLADRDLWKYEKALAALLKKAGEGTASGEELVWAANGLALTVGGEGRARELYAKARSAKPELVAVIDANVRWLDER